MNTNDDGKKFKTLLTVTDLYGSELDITKTAADPFRVCRCWICSFVWRAIIHFRTIDHQPVPKSLIEYDPSSAFTRMPTPDFFTTQPLASSYSPFAGSNSL